MDFREVDPTSDDARACVEAYFAELNERFPTGFDSTGATEHDAQTLTRPSGGFVVAYSDLSAVGCGGVSTIAEGVGEIKRMWLHRDLRGAGHGARLLSWLEAFSQDLGHTVVRLDTNSVLTSALAMYASAGYVEIPAYNENPYARHWFQKHH